MELDEAEAKGVGDRKDVSYGNDATLAKNQMKGNAVETPLQI